VTLTSHPLLVPWSWKSRAIPLLPLWTVRPLQSLSTCTRVTFTFLPLWKPNGSIPRSQQPATCPYPEPDHSSSHPLSPCSVTLSFIPIYTASSIRSTFINFFNENSWTFSLQCMPRVPPIFIFLHVITPIIKPFVLFSPAPCCRLLVMPYFFPQHPIVERSNLHPVMSGNKFHTRINQQAILLLRMCWYSHLNSGRCLYVHVNFNLYI